MSDTIYTRFFCDSPENNICLNPLCQQPTSNPKYCSLSCGNIHRGIKSRNKKLQEYEQNPKICQRSGCNQPIQFKSRKTAKFCSQSCSATVLNTGRVRPPVTDAFRQRMRDINLSKSRERELNKPLKICTNCQGLFYSKYRKTCSDYCCRSFIGKRMKEHIKVTPLHKFNRSPIKRSWMEQSFEDWLNDHGLKYGLSGYLTEVKFWNTESKKNGRADFVFPRRRLIIELDGTHHIKRKDLDDIRDSYLLNRGWTVFRIGYNEYKKKTKINEVKKLLNID
jgi:very-short-patch-repair endonuclease